jgi:hypothetical protein
MLSSPRGGARVSKKPVMGDFILRSSWSTTDTELRPEKLLDDIVGSRDVIGSAGGGIAGVAVGVTCAVF